MGDTPNSESVENLCKVQTCEVDVLGGVVVRCVVLSTSPIAMLNKLDYGSYVSSQL